MTRAARHVSTRGVRVADDDVGPDLKGRQAELYWPDDNLWYLIEIQAMNLRQKAAK